MWGKTKKIRTAKVDTLVGHGTRIEGDVIYTGGLHVDGRIVGNVQAADESDTDSILILSHNGSIEGEVRVPNLLLNGEVVGDVHSTGHVELAGEAKLNGNLFYNTLEMATGAEINGKMVHRASGPTGYLEHKREEVDQVGGKGAASTTGGGKSDKSARPATTEDADVSRAILD